MKQEVPHQRSYCRVSGRKHGLHSADVYSTRAYLRALALALGWIGEPWRVRRSDFRDCECGTLKR